MKRIAGCCSIHGIFQGYYFFHHLGLDHHLRDKFRGHSAFEQSAAFCARHDQSAFDKDYDTMPLKAFVPRLERMMDRPKHSIYSRNQEVGATVM